MVDEIANALSTQYGPSAVDEDDLLAELDALEQVCPRTTQFVEMILGISR